MSTQRAGATVEPSHRSILRTLPGVPWWAAVLLATGTTAVGYLLDAGHKELSHTFAGLYIAGCVAAVLVVRQSAVFTAVIQPPLILFCAVPGAYWLFHGGKVDKFKDLLINCGYPLIERFPLMLGTAGVVLLIGLLRWYIGVGQRRGAVAEAADETATPSERPSVFSGLAAKISSLLGPDPDLEGGEPHGPPAHSSRAARSSRTSRTSRSSDRSARARSRQGRPPLDGREGREERGESASDRPRRQTRRTPPGTAREFDADEPPRRPRRRPPPQGETDLRAQPPREMRRDPHARRNPYERPYDRPERRSSRFDPYDSYEPADPPERSERSERSARRRENGYDRYPDRYPPYEPPPRRRPAPNGNGAEAHQPISQVRYRTSAPREESRDERRSRPRAPRKPQDHEA